MVLSSLTCPLEARGDQLGSEVTLSLPRVGGPLTLRYRCGNVQGVIVRETTRETCAWVPPVELAAEYATLYAAYEAGGFVCEVETKASVKKSPVVSTLECLRRDILAIEDALGLTPRGLLKLQENAFKVAQKSRKDDLI